jgi:tRNA(Ile)-lysidine synthase
VDGVPAVRRQKQQEGQGLTGVEFRANQFACRRLFSNGQAFWPGGWQVLQQVRNYIARHGMILPGDLVLVAVSGGPDSLALLHALFTLAVELECRLHVFHLDHGLRGADSARDAAYTLEVATRLGLGCTIVRLEEGALSGAGLPAKTRAVRYREMERVAAQVGARRVALGHNLEDQAETVLMRVLRGAGTAGLGGIPPVRGSYVRPLLATPRAAIEQHCREYGLEPVRDPSNRRPVFLRNRIRLELLPHLAESYNPNVHEALARLADLAREEDDLLESLVAEALRRDGGLTVRGLRRVHPALARRMIRQAAGADLSFQAVEQVLALGPEGTQEVHLEEGLRVIAQYGQIRLERHGGQDPSPAARAGTAGSGGGFCLPLSVPGETPVPELGIHFSVRAETAVPADASKERVVLDQSRLPGPLAVRFRIPGDRLWPVGMEGSRKLQDIFVDAKVPVRLRGSVPLLVSGDQVVWAVGVRLDRRFLAGPETQDALLVQVSPLL